MPPQTPSVTFSMSSSKGQSVQPLKSCVCLSALGRFHETAMEVHEQRTGRHKTGTLAYENGTLTHGTGASLHGKDHEEGAALTHEVQLHQISNGNLDDRYAPHGDGEKTFQQEGAC